MIRHSVNLHRGCFGGCAFCTISAHQGKFVASRSMESIMREVEKVVEMEDFKGRIVSTLKQSLHNNNITLSIRVAKQKERVKIMTRREQFDMMREKNPAVEALRQAFDLELA